MTDRVEAKDDAMLDAAITRALEQPPSVVIPMDFAARVREALPARSKARVRRSVGRAVGTVAVAGLLVALCWLAPHARPNFENVAFDMELLMLAEVAGVAAWLAMRRGDA